jgi:hypothetical protein
MSREDIIWLLVVAVTLALSPIAFYLDALRGGWRTLAAKYPAVAKRRSGGQRRYFQTIYLEKTGTGYRNLVVVTIHQDGMQLDMPIFRLFYPPMFLPWKDIVAAANTQQLFFDCVQLTFAKSPEEPVTIHRSLEDEIFKSVGPAWSCEAPSRFRAPTAVASKLPAKQRL